MSTVVSKNVQIGADGTASNNFTAYQPSTPDGTLRIGNGNSGSVTDAIVLNSSGNVGIGTTSTTGKLNVAGNVAIADGGWFGFGDVNERIAGNNAGYLQFFTDGFEHMRLTSTGLGIGTSSPLEKLHVAGVIQASSGIKLNDTNPHYFYSVGASQIGVRFNDGATATGYMWLKNFAPSINGIGVSSGGLAFGTASTERMLINSSGNVGIGTNYPTLKLDVIGGTTSGSVDDVALFQGGASGVSGSGAAIFLSGGAGKSRAASIAGVNTGGANNAHAMTFSVSSGSSSPTERMRIDSSGNMMVGTTIYNPVSNNVIGFSVRGQYGETQICTDGAVSGAPLYLNRKTNNGSLVEFRKDGTTVGSILTTDSRIALIGYRSGISAGIDFEADNKSLRPCTGTGGSSDNTHDIGRPDVRWQDIYATNGTIQTSDRNEKQDIETLSEAEARVAVACKGLLRKFRWKDKVAEKGDEARIHFGIIAQDLQDAFAAEGLDAGRYAMFISSTWTDEETGEERTRLGVRYPELLAFIIAAI